MCKDIKIIRKKEDYSKKKSDYSENLIIFAEIHLKKKKRNGEQSTFTNSVSNRILLD